MLASKESLKRVLGELPLTAELDWYLRRRGEPVRGFSLEKLDPVLAEWQAQAAASPYRDRPGKRVLIFGTQRYWIEHTALLGLALSGLGHEVTLAYLPYADWRAPVNEFDLRQHNLYARRVLKQAEPSIDLLSLLDAPQAAALPLALRSQIEDLSTRDTQYTLQVEDIPLEDDLLQLRLTRNTVAAQAALKWLQTNQPDVLIVPNGLILELGALYLTARHIGIPTVTYEFGEQRGRIWLSQGAPVMIQETDTLWAARKDEAFSAEQLERIKELYAARRGASLYQHFYRYWQNLPSEGGAQLRAKLGLDERPVVLLAANVIGDSLTLGRQVFTDSMTDWLLRTLEHFAAKPDAQFILRAHPGEVNLLGPSVVDLAREALPDLPAHMRLIGPEEAVNTYDLVAIADLGLAYTTTVGMEMAMVGLPVIVLGLTHYRCKGFTLDPQSWDEYFQMLDRVLTAPEKARLSQEQVDTAWHYAYRFFFDYPQSFPWHLIHFWENVEDWPLSRVLTDEGMNRFGATFDYLVAEPLDWNS